jgi:hypothetical protein
MSEPAWLMGLTLPETDAQDRHLARRGGDEVEADAGLVRRAGARRQHDGLGPAVHHRRRRQRIVTPHLAGGAEVAEELHEVERKAVVVVDEDDHSHILRWPSGKGQSIGGNGWVATDRALAVGPGPWPAS